MAANPDRGRNVAIGCFMVPLGAASGGMTGVLVSKMVAWMTKAPACPDIPSCDWYVYAGWGALLGALCSSRQLTSAGSESAPPHHTSDTNRS